VINENRAENENEVAALRWLLRGEKDALSPREQQEFESWLTENDGNASAFAQSQSLADSLATHAGLRGLARVEDLDRYDFSDLEPTPIVEEKRGDKTLFPVFAAHYVAGFFRTLTGPGPLMAAAAAFAVLFIVVVVQTMPGSPAINGRVLATDIGEIRAFYLPDGSVITLGGKSRATLFFSDDQRRVEMDEGDAYFKVASQRNKPFLVESGSATVRVLGTEFEVRKRSDHVDIAVAEGLVEISANLDHRNAYALPGMTMGASLGEREGKKSVTLSDGQQVKVASSGLGDIQELKASAVSPWRNGRLFYDNASLEEMVKDFNRYYDGKIELADDSMKDLKISGSFKIDTIETKIFSLENILPVSVVKKDDKLIIIYQKREN
jgi:transmembrane sensor